MNKTSAATAVKFLDEGPGVIEGYASTFGPPADRVGDIIMPGAFGMNSYQVPLLAYHDAERPIGVAVHTPDQYGLHTRAVLAETAFAQEQRELFKVGAIPAFSIGYDFKNEANKRNDHGGWDLYAVEHMETSGVPIPANPRALVTMAKAVGYAPEASKPYRIEEQGGKYCVIGGSSGSQNFGCHDTRAEAEAQMRALYANEGKGLGAELIAFVKAGARNSMTDQQALDAAHEAIVNAGAKCAGVMEKAWAPPISLDADLLAYELENLT